MKFPHLILMPLLLLSLVPPSSAYLRLKFHHRFPKYQSHWLSAASKCQPQLTNYYHHTNTPDCSAPCSYAADCLLTNVTGTMASNMASDKILLSLMPSMLAYFGPTTAEVALLSTYRPILAGLLALGSPAVQASWLFKQIDISESSSDSSKSGGSSRPSILFLWAAEWLSRRSHITQTSLEILGYTIALGAIANNIRTSITLDLRTISGWRCGVLFLPLSWSLLGLGVHVFGFVAVRQRGCPVASTTTSHVEKTRRIYLLIPTFSSSLYRAIPTSTPTILSELLFCSGSLATIAHTVFGMLVLSSLIFIDTLEAFEVFVLYAVSAAVCQFVLCLQLAMLKLRVRAAK